MTEKDYWDKKWKERKLEEPNNFAKRCYVEIKKNNFKTVLDLGCGDGRDTLFFASKGFLVTAVDYSEVGIKKLSKVVTKNVKTEVLDIRKIAYPKNSFDLIYAHLSLQFFTHKDNVKIFNKLYAILKPKGMIFIKVKSTDDKLYGIGKKIEENVYFKSHLRHFFTKDYMKEKLIKFTILKIRKNSSSYHQHKSAFIEAVARKE